ncbi:hypothetical protein SAMN04489712_13036 [Thermomonospora echinospora]|uniref:Uncharacterized protein n=1 Tax=Thermomonospora echinospora TaxID=1992 RepID=A0A1H6E237_9ACTN|nr:hypothetical protein [Thermomonospora echinospora]SEG91738.1 hypothetical protein SAMN04489712_13036 [Thermomonospora echinospora]
MTGSTILDPLTMKRLAFIRLLYQQGVDQSRLPEPLNFTSVLSFHDAVEHFLVLTGEHLGATLPNHIQFMRYWDELHPNKLANGIVLSGKVAMDRLNRARNNFKHVGALPGTPTVEQARGDVTAFFEDNTPRVFGAAFNEIDMADLVTHEDTRSALKRAAAAWDAGEHVKAMALLVNAFDDLFDEYVSAKGARQAFAFGPQIGVPLLSARIATLLEARPSRAARKEIDLIAELLDQVAMFADPAQQALRVMSLGIAYDEYVRFRSLCPWIMRMDPDLFVQRPKDYTPTVNDFRYCQQFMITVALRITEMQTHLPEVRQGEKETLEFTISMDGSEKTE